MTGKQLQSHVSQCRRAGEIARKTWDKILAKKHLKHHNALFRIGNCRQRRAVVLYLLAELSRLQQQWTASDTDHIHIKRVRFLSKCIERHLRSLLRLLTATEAQSLFASISLPNGKKVKIYGFMPVPELKQLAERYQVLAEINPDIDIPDVYN